MAINHYENKVSSSNYMEAYLSNPKLTPGQLKKRQERVLQQEYAKLPLQTPHSILWIGDIMADGWGDLTNCLQAVQLTKQEYPHWTMRLIVYIQHLNIPIDIAEYGLKEEEFLVIRSLDQRYFPSDEKMLLEEAIGITTDDQVKLANEKRRTEHPLLAKKVDEFAGFFKTADLQIAVSVPIPEFLMKCKSIDTSSPRFMLFQEYGMRADKESRVFCMGLGPHSSGIYILNPNVPEQFTNHLMKEYFQKKDKVHFCYGTAENGNIQEYLSAINCFNPEDTEINVVTNLTPEKIPQMTEILSKQGIKTILFVDKTGAENKVFESDSLGKTIRLINPFPISHQDILLGIKMAEEPVGITGNSSFSEAFALDRLPFYNIRCHLTPFWKNLIDLAKCATPQSTALIAYLEYILPIGQIRSGPFPEGRVKALQELDLCILKQQWLDLTFIIRRDWNVKESYLGEINRQILSRQ